jgi:two-component system, LytTR family, sensor kinase
MQLGARFWKVQLLGWLAYAIVGYVLSLPGLAGGGLERHLAVIQFKGARSAIGLALSVGMTFLFKRLWARRPSAWVLGLVSVVVSGLLSVVWLAALRGVVGSRPIIHAGFAHDLLNYVVLLLAWSGLFLSYAYRLDLEAERERALRALSLASEARWQMLRYQVNPHFLFNALNSIRALVDEDPGRARNMITELADFFRYSLLETQARDVPLGDELRAIQSYLTIQRIRFEERLRVTFDVEPRAERVRLPGFLIHPLVENAVKHGLDARKGPVELRVRAALVGDVLEVEVANTGGLRPAPLHAVGGHGAVQGTGTGLANIRERLAHAFPGRHRFELHEDDGWVRATLSVELGRREAA